jgi:CYTH domain-containing protein
MIFSKVYMKMAKHLITIKFAQNKKTRNFHGSIYGVNASQMLQIASGTLVERRKKYAI